MPARNLFLSSILSLLLLCCTAQLPSCPNSTCGAITISYPFRLSSDPAHCGLPDPRFALHCVGDRAFLTSGSRRSYAVQAITYGNYSIRLADPGLDARNYSSCPVHSSEDDDGLSSRSLSFHPNSYSMSVWYITCLNPVVNNAAYIEDPACGNASAFSNSSSSVHSYLGRNMVASDLESSCIVDKKVRASSSSSAPLGDSYSAIHDLLSYGFEYSWYRIECAECDGSCSLEKKRVRCRHYCYEDTPLAERSFRCKLEYYSPLILLVIVPAIAGIILVRFILVIAFVIATAVSKRRQQPPPKPVESDSMA